MGRDPFGDRGGERGRERVQGQAPEPRARQEDHDAGAPFEEGGHRPYPSEPVDPLAAGDDSTIGRQAQSDEDDREGATEEGRGLTRKRTGGGQPAEDDRPEEERDRGDEEAERRVKPDPGADGAVERLDVLRGDGSRGEAAVGSADPEIEETGGVRQRP